MGAHCPRGRHCCPLPTPGGTPFAFSRRSLPLEPPSLGRCNRGSAAGSCCWVGRRFSYGSLWRPHRLWVLWQGPFRIPCRQLEVSGHALWMALCTASEVSPVLVSWRILSCTNPSYVSPVRLFCASPVHVSPVRLFCASLLLWMSPLCTSRLCVSCARLSSTPPLHSSRPLLVLRLASACEPCSAASGTALRRPCARLMLLADVMQRSMLCVPHFVCCAETACCDPPAPEPE